MKYIKSIGFIVGIVIVCGAFLSNGVFSQKSDMKHKKAVNADVLNGWTGKPRETAMKLIAKYGQPNESTPSMLMWNNNGEWKRTIIYRDEVPHSFPMPHTDFLEQFIDYRAPVNKYSEIAEYDGSVITERTKGEMSARCDLEEMNRLALNLAHEVATEKRSVKDARKFYAETAMAFKQGKTSPYLTSLQFDIQRGTTADTDQPVRSTMAADGRNN